MLTRSRVILRRRAGLMLALAAVLLLGSWIAVEPRDDGWLLVAAGRPFDVRGAAEVAWSDLRRDCRAVQDLAPGTPDFIRSETALREFSPPDSASARVLRMQALGPWRTVQATFDRLEPVVVLMRDPPGSAAAQVLGHAVWSGPTRPWQPAWRIRGFLGSREAGVPAALIDCLDPAAVFQAGHRP